jgi:preprotein translocase subunit SecE
VARNRKRRSDRRPHQPTDDAALQPGIATASAFRRDEPADHAHSEPKDPREDETPDPLEHGTPDVELAEAQLAVGRPELADQTSEEELTKEALEAGGGGRGRGGRGGRRGGGGGDGAGAEGASPGELAPSKAGPLARLVHFLQGSWRELQRVQWPDRRQVTQATAVVIGFVIVAGVFLGVADLIATRVVNFILK